MRRGLRRCFGRAGIGGLRPGLPGIGNPLAEGAYKLTVSAKDSASNDITAAVASAGVVSQIDMSGGTPLLVIGKMEVGFADVAAVAN